MQILIEGIVLAFSGGVVGLAAGFGLVQALEAVAPLDNRPVVEPFAIIVSLAFAIGVGVVAGLYPAFKASRLSPLQALRYE